MSANRNYDPMAYVRQQYGVPAVKGGRVEYTGGAKPEMGTITGVEGAHVMIKLDGGKHSTPYHPTWELRYLDASQPTQEG